MRARGSRVLTWVGAVLLVTVTGCGGHHSASSRGPDDGMSGSASASAPGSVGSAASRRLAPTATGPLAPKSTVLTLHNGRRVAMRYVGGKGLLEQRYTPGRGWTAPRVIYRTRIDPCQDITLRAAGGTVAVIADFGTYCYDGEPPTRSIAGIATGSLRTWQLSVTKNFDGWQKVTFARGGTKATFSEKSTAGLSSVVWTRHGGFSPPHIATFPPRAIDKHFLGTWELTDGSGRVRIEGAEPGDGLATFTTSGSTHCVAQVDLIPSGTQYVDFAGEPVVTEGSRTANCPPPTANSQFTTVDGETLRLVDVGAEEPTTLLTYTRVSAG
jgi:hypothetical protein